MKLVAKPVYGRAGCIKSASPDLWGPGAVNRPGLPGSMKERAFDLEDRLNAFTVRVISVVEMFPKTLTAKERS